jgi:hypothetical protein
MGWFLSKEYLEWNILVVPTFRTQYILDFFVAEQYGLQNTTYKDLASALTKVNKFFLKNDDDITENNDQIINCG